MNESLHPLARMHVTNLKRKDKSQREEKKKKLTLKRIKENKVINSIKITSLRKGSNTSSIYSVFVFEEGGRSIVVVLLVF